MLCLLDRFRRKWNAERVSSSLILSAAACVRSRYHVDTGVPHEISTSGKEQMSYVDSHLVPGETVIYETRLHWIVMLGHIVVGCLLLALPGAFLLYYAASQTGIESGNLHIMEGGGVALIVCGVVAILMGMVRRNATEMALTDRRVVIKTGLVGRKTIEMLLNKVESIEVSETVLGRGLGGGRSGWATAASRAAR